MSKQPKRQAATHTQPSIGQSLPKDVMKRDFVKLVFKSDNGGGNSHVADFLAAMDDLCASKQSFTVLDCLYFAQRFQIPPVETKRLFELWTDFNLGWHRVSVIDGCYQNPLVVCLV